LEGLSKFKNTVRPILSTIYLELKLQKLKFIIFSSVSIVLYILIGLIPYISYTPSNQATYLQNASSFYIFMVILSIGIFFSSIICSEYQRKTGLTIFPLINKTQLIIGKYIANYILVIGIGAIYFSFMGIFNYYFYGGPILYTIFISFSFLALYLLALASFTTFLSSFMPSNLPVFAIITGFLLLGSLVIDPVLRTLGANLEPFYSISYLYNIVSYTLYPNFSSIERYYERGNIWMFPSAEGAIIMLTIYAIVFFLLAYLIFRRRQL
jgi:ABC-type transport system involved in multi-copper enzyme maturation permease subunit